MLSTEYLHRLSFLCQLLKEEACDCKTILIKLRQSGINILKRALEEPIRQIAANAGIDGAVVIQKIKEAKAGIGFNAEKMEYEDLMAAGIVDPTKVVRSALQNAASSAAMFLTTEAVVAEKPEEKKAGGMPGAGMGMPEY